MNRKIVLLVLVFGLLSAISSCNLKQNTTETNRKNINENNTFDTFKEDIDEQTLKANQLLEEALNLLHKSMNKLNIRNAYSLLEKSAKLNNLRAKEMMAQSYLFGDHLSFDAKKALNYLESIPINQSSRAHLFLGFMYSLGLGVDISQEKSLSNYKLAANMSNPLAQLVIAFRYNNGLGLNKNCRKALDLYQSVATSVVEDSKDFGGKPFFGKHFWQIKDEKSVKFTDVIDKDLIDYYQFMAKGGDNKARVSLGTLYYFGGYGIDRDRSRALNYFQEAAKFGNPNALAFLGKYYLEGTPIIQQNYTKAFKLFAESAEKRNPIGMTELGLMYRYGKGVDVNLTEAFKYFAQSSRQGCVEAILELGTMYLDGLGVARDYRKAIKSLTHASHSNHLIAIYKLGQLQADGIGVMRSCQDALLSMKSVAERGIWSELFGEAYDDYRNGRIAEAFIKFSFLSEMGYELSQSNAAFIVENEDISSLKPYLTTGPALALKYWKASAAQGSSHSRIKVGDYHYYGLGTPVDYRMAAFHYRRASEHRYSGQALFNLGYLSEKGKGVEKNLKMAKVYYDMSAQVDKEAIVPAFLAKIRLRATEVTEKCYRSDRKDLVLIVVLSIILGIALYLKLRSP